MVTPTSRIIERLDTVNRRFDDLTRGIDETIRKFAGQHEQSA